MSKQVPLEEVKGLLQTRMNHVFGDDPSEVAVYNEAVKKANEQIQELVEKYEK